MSWTLGRSRFVYAASYVVAAVVAALVWMAAPDLGLYARAMAAGAAATAVLYVAGMFFSNSGFYDVYWSLAPVAFGLLWLVEASAWRNTRAILAVTVTAAWGLRLTFNWVRHFQGLGHEDWRYVDLRQKTGRLYPLASLFALHVLPYSLVSLGSLPIYTAIQSRARLGAVEVVAFAVGLIAIVVETVSDLQLGRFRRENRDPDGFLSTGLWAYSRHPNYFGEVLFWWSVGLFGYAVVPSVVMLLGALGVTSMIVFASIPMAERRALAKRPRFADYQRRVSGLVPWLPGR